MGFVAPLVGPRQTSKEQKSALFFHCFYQPSEPQRWETSYIVVITMNCFDLQLEYLVVQL